MKHVFSLAVLLTLGLPLPVGALMVQELSLSAHVAAADAVCRGTVLRTECFRREGQIYTRAHVRVDETFKGIFPPVVQLTHRGGRVGDEGDWNGSSPELKAPEERLFLLARRADGTLRAAHGAASALLLADGAAPAARRQRDRALLDQIRQLTRGAAGADVRDQAGDAAPAAAPAAPAGALPPLTGLFFDGIDGLSSRFVQPDRGEPIPVLIDADFLPAGISVTQAVQAVMNAAAAWEAVSTVRFRFEGLQSFGQAAPDVAVSDGRLRVQMHDAYNFIAPSSTLAIGGRSYSINVISPPGWADGGNVAGYEFHRTLRGYIVVEHTKTLLQNLVTLTEVLCHEVGHTLSLAHSSEDPGEPNPTLTDAIMYYTVHADGRGARLGAYDPPIVRQAHPLGNTPPYVYPRVMDITTDSPSQPNIAGVNEIELRGYDLQTTNLTLLTTNHSMNNGSFSRAGNTLRFTAAGFISTPMRLDPAGNSFYDRLHMRCSDGVHASPHATVRVLSFSADRFPSPAGDGIPDAWMITHWGSANPADGPNRGAGADFDSDGLSNLREYLLGTSPTDFNSKLQITAFDGNTLQWEARPYDLYEIHSTTNLPAGWRRTGNPVLPTASPGVASGLRRPGARHEFFRVEKVP
jgi:hypothetical protein